MQVSEAVASRRSVRAFLNTPVDPEVLRRVLTRAQRAPSGSNVQPWHAVLLTGEPLARLQAAVAAEFPKGRAGHSIPFHMHPVGIDGVYKERLFGVGEALYKALGIARDDKAGRLGQYARNYEFFGAPCALFLARDKSHGAAQWADIGGYLQTVALLARGHDLHTCPQQAWVSFHRTVRFFLDLPDDLMGTSKNSMPLGPVRVCCPDGMILGD